MPHDELMRMLGWSDSSLVEHAIARFGMPRPIKVTTTQKRESFRTTTEKKTLWFDREKIMEWRNELRAIGGFSR